MRGDELVPEPQLLEGNDRIGREDFGIDGELELGVGGNTPVIIKYPFWQMTLTNGSATYACLNYGEANCPEEIAVQSICIDGDIAEILTKLK